MTNEQLRLIEDLRHALHACPERSGQETQTKALLQEFLRAHTTLELQPWAMASMPRTAKKIP